MKKTFLFSCRLICLLFLVVQMMSCSLKIDRTDCPCYVSVQVQTSEDCLVSFYDEFGALLTESMIDASLMCSGKNYTKVRKGSVRVSVLAGYGKMTLKDNIVSVLSNNRAAPLYSCYLEGDATGDELHLSGELYKQHVNINVSFLYLGEEMKEGKGFPYYPELRYSYDSFDRFTHEGLGQENYHKMEADKDLKCMYRILRQRPDTKITLILEHWITGTRDYVINVSGILDYIEYSWKKDNLDDIDLVFDLGYMTASVKIDGWLINAPFDYEI